MSSIEQEFLRSALATDSSVYPLVKVMRWIEERRSTVRVLLEKAPLDELRKWHIDESTGEVSHESGGFFSIMGIRVRTNWRNTEIWDQPIINQPEIGFLGFITKKIDGVLHFLVQAKIEPGNINTVQISPTLQATRSNYSQLHKGKRPRYLEFFNGERKVIVLLDQLQSEQGARFLRKRNRNIIVQLIDCDDIEDHPDFAWVTLGQIKALMRIDNVVNMDTRTVISGINYGLYASASLLGIFIFSPRKARSEMMLSSALTNESSVNDFKGILSWITRLKSTYDLYVENIPINKMNYWRVKDGEIRRDDGKYFSVIGVKVSIANREVVNWDQPMIRPAQEGLVAFIIKPMNGVYHFLVQAKLEAGNFDVIELAPTVQCLTGNYRLGHNEYSVPYIREVLAAKRGCVVYDSMQSEEGGRFYMEQNRNMIVEVGDDFPVEVEDNYCWMTLNQMLRLIEFNNFLNISARSLIASISFE